MSDVNVEGVSVGHEPVAAAIAEGAWAQKIEFADPPPGATYFAWPSRICCSAVVKLALAVLEIEPQPLETGLELLEAVQGAVQGQFLVASC